MTSLSRKFGRFLRWGCECRSEVLRAAAMLVVVRPALGIIGLRRVRGLLARASRRRSRATAAAPDSGRVVWAVETVSRNLPGRWSCLPRAVVVEHLLRCRGLPAVCRFGVDREPDGKLVAHAWVELHGDVVAGATRDLERYAVLGARAGVAR